MGWPSRATGYGPRATDCGVEVWRGGLGRAYPFAGSFGCRCLTSQSMLRFHIPLIKPDVQIFRIRLSDKDSRLRPREAGRHLRKADETQRLVQGMVRGAGGAPAAL